MIRWGRTRAGAKWHAVKWEPHREWFERLCGGWGIVMRERLAPESWDPAPSERCKTCSVKYRKAAEGEPDGK